MSEPSIPFTSDGRSAGARLRAILDDLPPELAPPPPGSPPGRILAAARLLFAEGGPASVSVRAVAQAADVNQAMINYYFGTKQRLIDAVITQEMLQVIRDVMSGVDPQMSTPDLLAEFPLRILDSLRRDRLRLQLLRITFATEPDRLRTIIRNLGQHGVLGAGHAVASLIVEAQAAGDVVDLPARSVLLYLIANAYGLVLMEPMAREVVGFVLEDDAHWQPHRRNLRTLIRHGILARPDAGGQDHA